VQRTSLFHIAAAAAIVGLAACESASVSSPLAPDAANASRSSAHTQSCTITLPAPVNRPLPAVREVAREVGEAFSNPQSTANCGIVTGIEQRFNQLVAKLDLPAGEQNLFAACGIATGLANQLRALAESGQLNPIVTHPPQASPNVVENMDHIRSEFCENARL
jgi:hypothetical protein